MKVQVKPRETDDLAAREATLRTGDTSTCGPYNIEKWRSPQPPNPSASPLKEAKAAYQKAEKAEEKLMEHYAAYQKLYAKRDGLLKASKEADAQAQEKIQELEGEKAELKEKAAQSADEIAQLRAELEKERADQASFAAASAAQEPEQFAARAIPDRETAIRFFHDLFKHEVSAKVVDEIGTFGFESG
ncbi:unnamed protein product [Cuscuta campestris]|uniref:Uncharacterized protein n=1 Tax=Cuscuta campestris TaxID=132261 RepID=A0A484M917_9ASTE|nr:unnamed protein product [Cuscuta campestris]